MRSNLQIAIDSNDRIAKIRDDLINEINKLKTKVDQTKQQELKIKFLQNESINLKTSLDVALSQVQKMTENDKKQIEKVNISIIMY